MLRLKTKEICPIHRRRDCCGRAEFHRYSQVQHELKYRIVRGVKIFPDGREVCSKAELKHRKDALLRQDPRCAACGQAFRDYSEVELGHKRSKGMGSAKRDDRRENLFLLHVQVNNAQGSMDWDEYVKRLGENNEKFPCEE